MTAELTADDIGVAAVTTTEISAEHAGKVAAVLDVADDLPVGAELPLLWHWAFFTPAVLTAGLGHDGHPRCRHWDRLRICRAGCGPAVASRRIRHS